MLKNDLLFIRQLKEKIDLVMKHKALHDDHTDYVVVITKDDLKQQFNRNRLGASVVLQLVRELENVGFTAFADVDKLQLTITAHSILLDKPRNSLSDLFQRAEILEQIKPKV